MYGIFRVEFMTFSVVPRCARAIGSKVLYKYEKFSRANAPASMYTRRTTMQSIIMPTSKFPYPSLHLLHEISLNHSHEMQNAGTLNACGEPMNNKSSIRSSCHSSLSVVQS